MTRSRNGSWIWLLFLFSVIAGCAESIDRETPPEDAIFSVTDMVLTADGGYLLVLSGNFERAYDHGRISVWDIAAKKVTSSLLVGSLGGRLFLTSDEKTLYVTTREAGLLHRIDISHDLNGKPWLAYGGSGLGEVSVAVRPEPYAMSATTDEGLLLVTHLLNGEVAVFQRAEGSADTLAGIFQMESGITDIVADPLHDVFLTAHKRSDRLGLLRITADTPATKETPGTVSAVTGYIDLPLPLPGVDVRDIVTSIEQDATYYLSYRNRDDAGYESPMLLKMTIGEEGGVFTARRSWATALQGDIGEAAVVSCQAEPDLELVFVAVPSDRSVSVVESFGGTLVGRIDLEDCTPYQLYSRPWDPERRLFVGCFREDRVLILNADCTGDGLFAVEEDIR